MFAASTVLQPHSFTLSQRFEQICANYGVDEAEYLAELLPLVPRDQIDAISARASHMVEQVRAVEKKGLAIGIDAFLQEYSLETHEGVLLMCLAEALLRIPDAPTADALIEEKLASADWGKHLKCSDSMLVNASTWALMLTGKVMTLDKTIHAKPASAVSKLINRVGEPVIRSAMYSAMKIMGKQFVLGRDISEALKRSQDNRQRGYSHSFDMLGEAALTQADADKYCNEYRQAIATIGSKGNGGDPATKPTISIKLSALHPRYEVANRQRVLSELRDTVLQLINQARPLDVGISIDAEEADRLELSLELFEQIYRHPDCQGWGNLGLVVQAYSKRALPVLCWINALAAEQGDLIPVRLVKGAYWDSEIKWCQQAGSDNYPVFTRKAGTDISYLACARYLLSPLTTGNIYPQFATHNAQTVASIEAMAGSRDYEFQRLHGMGQELYDTLLTQAPKPLKVRIYAPVGAHKDLLPYLVRRLLENGANTSFVHKLVDPKTPIDSLVTHPLTTLESYSSLHNPRIPLPSRIFSDRFNSQGLNLNLRSDSQPFFAEFADFQATQWRAAPIIGGEARFEGDGYRVNSPLDGSEVGCAHYANDRQIEEAISRASSAFAKWNATPVEQRAQALERLADLLESHRPELIALCCREAGKTLQDGIDEVREAVDFCRYYANQARELMVTTTLPGPTGERNQLSIHGRGTFLCISPWNFPLAIFLGQITAALATGNCVIAKPAEQTNLIAFRAVELAHQAGIDQDALQLLTGLGRDIGPKLTADERISGVCFTGSTATAKGINLTLAQRAGAIVPLIAETGGQNAMIVDSTSLPEQVIIDVVQSAFQSAGQRCSALRVLFLQQDVAPRMLALLKGAMAELTIGDPSQYQTDVGPVIDANAKAKLEAHIERICGEGELIAQTEIPSELSGHFVAPTAVKIDSLAQLTEEQFGPILHVITYSSKQLPEVIDQINASGYGLTLGIHSRNERHALQIASQVNVGNAYINRNQIGAVVGVQPFGGQGLSGTGHKAGGPHYLSRFISEKTISNNITAIGGNATLLSLGDG